MARKADQRYAARVAVLVALRDFCRVEAGTDGEILARFVTEYAAGRLPVESAVRETMPVVAVRTLRRWRSSLQDGGLASLRTEYRGRPSYWERNPQARDCVIGILARAPRASAPRVAAALVAAGFPRVGAHTVQRLLGELAREGLPAPQGRAVNRWRRALDSLLVPVDETPGM